MNILIHSNSAANRYGYSIVGMKIAEQLQESGHQVIYFGMQSIHPPYKADNGIVYVGIREDPFGSDALDTYIKAYNIDILLTMWDVWLPQARYIPKIVKNNNIKWILHLTVNSTPLSPYFNVLPHADYIIAPSRFVYQEIYAQGFRNVVHIPHGVDTGIFLPEENKPTDDNFIFLTVARNKGLQKNYPALFKAYANAIKQDDEFAKNARLWLLTDPIEGEGIKIVDFINNYGLKNHISLIGWKPNDDLTSIVASNDADALPHFANCNLPDTEMNKVYNSCDCYVSASSGESFGLGLIEAQSCGKPCIGVANTTGPELVGIPCTGLLADVGLKQITPLLTDIYHVDVDSLTKQFLSMYHDKKAYIKFRENAIKNADKYAWTVILPKWTELIDSIDMVGVTDYRKGNVGL